MKEADLNDWKKYQNGDNTALENIYNRHKDKMFNYCIYLTGDIEISEDIIQDTFLKLAQQKDKLSDLHSLKDWLFIIMRNKTFNILKKKPVPVYQPIGLEQTISIEDKLFIEKILSSLERDERELILMREQFGYSIKEIASMLDIKEEAVRVRLFRIRKKMQILAKE
jgi:RNA polymerase sigma-70 factor (ECF subfamily)